MYTVAKLDDYSPAALQRASTELLRALAEEAGQVANEEQWKSFRDRWMARKNGVLTQINDLWLKAAPGPQKREAGRVVNELKSAVEEQVESAKTRASGGGSLERERLDVTLPGIHRPLGAEHPILRTMNDVVGVFKAMGYSVAEGPEVETDYYNFESLNFPPNHPARDMQDTLFIAGQENKPQRDRLLLRTHTSPVQIRTMEGQKPPIRAVIPGRVYRKDTPDATHSPMFHQVEGLCVDTNITFRDMKGSLDQAIKLLFGANVRTRLRPSFFPFTEPSAEMLMSCIFCGGSGQQASGRCPNCKGFGWIEVLGCGMVDPALYGFVDYDPEKVSGFAFGMGADRIASLRWGVTDLQLFFNGDVRFLEQFG